MNHINNDIDHILLRRSQNTLIVVGSGTILFSVWTVVKTLGSLLLLRDELVAFLRKTIDETVDSAHDKVQEVLDKTDIDEKIQGVLDKTDIDEKIVEVKDMVVAEVKETKDAAVKFVKEKTKTEEPEVKETKKTTKKTTKKKGEKK